jgi:dolichyl-diphosphooligosaccharide--protein glycosyltransferase
LGIIVLAVFYIINPAMLLSMLKKFQVLVPNANSLTISEVQPLFIQQGRFTLSPIWNAFTTSAILAPVSFILLLITALKRPKAEMILFLVWCALMFAATTGQIRFAEYLTINFALLSAYLLMEMVRRVPGFLKWMEFKAPQETADKKAKIKKSKNLRKSSYPIYYKIAQAGIAIAVVFLLGILPNIMPTKSVAAASSGISQEWYDALTWMRQNTPEPFGDAGFFDGTYDKPEKGKRYSYPETAYGIMNWWPYGHWITEVAERIPTSNPHQAGAYDAAKYFTEQDEAEANEVLNRLGSKYIIIDFDTAMPVDSRLMTKSFPLMAIWVNKSIPQYCEIYYEKEGSSLKPVMLYYPDFYQCISTRLHSFHGEEVTPANSTVVVSYIQDSGRKIIQSKQTFGSYEEGKAYLEKQTAPNYRLVGTSPLESPVPVERLEHYQEIYRSDTSLVTMEGVSVPFLRIFEYRP